MRCLAKFILVISVSAALGVSLGLTPSMLRDAGNRPAEGLSRAAQTEHHSFRSRFNKFVAESPAPGVLQLSGVFEVGDPEDRDEVRAQHLKIISGDGKVVVDREMKRIQIAAGEHSGEFPFEYRFELPAGTYKVHAISHVPDHTLTDENGVVGPLIELDALRTVDVP